MSERIPRKEYLSKGFDYTRLTKQQLRRIMNENHVKDIPGPNSLKNTILDAYKKHIHDRIDELAGRFSNENIFQASSATAESELEETDDLMSSLGRSTASPSDASQLNDESFISYKRPGDQSHASADGSHVPGERAQRPNESVSSAAGQSTPRKTRSGGASLGSDDDPDSTPTDGDRLATPDSSSVQQSRMMPCSDHASVVFSGRDGVKKYAPRAESPGHARHFFRKRYVFLAALVSFLVYLKVFCPYCTPETSVCIPVPRHAYLADGRLQCEPGYRLVRGIIDHCVIDDTEKLRSIEKAKSIIKMLEHYKGEQEYGVVLNKKIKLEDITSDPEIQRLLRESGRLDFANGYVTAKQGRKSLKVVVRYYLRRIVWTGAPLLLFLLVARLYLGHRRREARLAEQAHGVAKDVLGILSKQLLASVRSPMFNPEVSEAQLRDALDIPDRVWRRVVSIVRRNANVKCGTGVNGEMTWTWNGPVLPQTG